MPKHKTYNYQRSAADVQAGVRKIRHLSGAQVGNLRLMLQVRLCSAALIIDEWMQI
jgi:hypothetical protein